MKQLNKIILILVMLFSTTAYSQVKTTIGVGANLSSGNTNMIGISSNNSFSKEGNVHGWSIIPQFNYALVQTDNGDYETKQRETYVTANYGNKYGRNKVLANGEFENSYLKRINARATLGIGYGYDFIKRENITFSLSEAIVGETYYSDVHSSKNLKSIRLSTRIKFEINKPFKFSSVTLIQPAIANSQNITFENNINLRSINTILIPVTKKFSLGLNCTINGSTYSSFVDNSVKPYDIITALQLTYKNF